MSTLERKELNYIVACVNVFAQEKRMTPKDAFFYLDRYRGLAYLQEFYEVEHTLSWADTMEALTTVCGRNGGLVQ